MLRFLVIKDVAIMAVRYFSRIKLKAGSLAKAYTIPIELTLKDAGFREAIDIREFWVRLSYEALGMLNGSGRIVGLFTAKCILYEGDGKKFNVTMKYEPKNEGFRLSFISAIYAIKAKCIFLKDLI